MVVSGVEFKAPVWHGRDFPAAHSVVHAYFRLTQAALVGPGLADDGDDVPRLPSLLVASLVIVLGGVGFCFDNQEIVGTEAFSRVEGPCKAPRGFLRQQRKGNDLIRRPWALCCNDLVELQENLGAEVELGARAWLHRLGEKEGRLGARRTLLQPVVSCTATGGRGP